MASFKVNDCAPLFVGAEEEPPSCMNLSCVLRPQSGAVRIMFLVVSPLVSTIPSPVPMSCSRKSEYGWMILLPSASGTVNCPPLMTEPTGAVGCLGRAHEARERLHVLAKSYVAARVFGVGHRVHDGDRATERGVL